MRKWLWCYVVRPIFHEQAQREIRIAFEMGVVMGSSAAVVRTDVALEQPEGRPN